MQLVVRPLRARRAAHVPVRAVVGDDHPVVLQRLEHDPRLAREAGDRVALLQAEAHAHRRQIGIGLVAREVARGPDIGAARVLDGEAQRVVDPAAGDVLVTCEPGEDGEAGRVGRRPAGRPELVRAEVEDRRPSPPASRRPKWGRARTARRACSCRGRRSARADRRRTRGRPRSRRSSGSGTAPCPTRPRTRRRRATSPVALPTTVTGIPIGPPSQRPEPKSACMWSSTPIAATTRSEFGATGSLSTRWFQGLDGGKHRARRGTWQLGGLRGHDAEPEHGEEEDGDSRHRSGDAAAT